MVRDWKSNVSLKEMTSFKIGGPARFLVSVSSEEELKKAVREAQKENLSIFVLGGGTNLLVSDQGFPGLVIKIAFDFLNWQGEKVMAGAGLPLSSLVEEARKRELAGLEWATGIPGTLGGAVRGNAGTKDESLSEVLKEIRVFNQKTLSFQNLSSADCSFSYRESIFKKRPELIIFSAVLELTRSSKEEIEKKMVHYREIRKKQPRDFPSAGSVFKNPSSASAGWLIEKTGLKGRKIGQAQVSSRHANFIINLGEARSNQVLELIKEIQTAVEEKFGLQLEKEIVFLGEKLEEEKNS